AALRDLPERAGQLLVRHHLARPRAAVAEIEPLRLSGVREDLARLLEEGGVHPRQRHALLAVLDGRAEDAWARQAAEALERGHPAAEVTGRGEGLGPTRQLGLGGLAGIGGERRRADEVQHVAFPRLRP